MNTKFKVLLGTLIFLSLNIFIYTNQNNFASADTGNLIKNPSAEIIDSGNSPIGWHKDSWGSNISQFQYINQTAYEGKWALKVSISKYTDGDAKWSFDSIEVNAGKTYIYSDYYRSSVPTNIFAQYQKTDGTIFYQWLTKANTSSNRWKNIQILIQIPDNVSRLTVFHVISQKGWLITDSYSLIESGPLTYENGVPNASMEQSNPVVNLPLGWDKNYWGSLTAQFDYLNTGHTGNKSVKVTVKDYLSGDAKWFFEPQKVTEGVLFRIKDYYKSDTYTNVIMLYLNNDGSSSYSFLGILEPTSKWIEFSSSVIIPQGVYKASVLHILSSNGYLITDDYSFQADNPLGLKSGIVSLTFDDGYKSTYNNALPLLKEYNYKSTQYIIVGNIDTNDLYMTRNDLNDLYLTGQEIASHTVTHLDLTDISGVQLNTELNNSSLILHSLGFGNINDFASPHGKVNQNVLSVISAYYQTHRGVNVGFNSLDDLSVYNLKVQNVNKNTNPLEVQKWIKAASEKKIWLILVYHDITNTPDDFGTTPQNLRLHFEAIKNLNIEVKTINEAWSEVKTQIN